MKQKTKAFEIKETVPKLFTVETLFQNIHVAFFGMLYRRLVVKI